MMMFSPKEQLMFCQLCQLRNVTKREARCLVERGMVGSYTIQLWSNQIRLGNLEFKAILETRLVLAGAKYGSAPSPFPCRSCLHCKGAPLGYI